jgi:hypothetical protein
VSLIAQTTILSRIFILAAAGWGLAAKSGDPAVNDICRAATAVVGVNVNSIHRAVCGAGTAFHADIPVDDSGFAVQNPENAVGADLFAVAATNALFLR